MNNFYETGYSDGYFHREKNPPTIDLIKSLEESGIDTSDPDIVMEYHSGYLNGRDQE